MVPSKPDSEFLETFRPYLRFRARVRLGRALRRLYSASDIVQETLVNAVEAWEAFEFHGDVSVKPWLDRVLENRVEELRRSLTRQKRDIRREVPLETSFDDATKRIERVLIAPDDSPGTLAAHDERVLQIAATLEQLPEDQFEVIVCHYVEQISLREIADEMGRTRDSVAGLLRRGLEKLRECFRNQQECDEK